MILFTLHLKNNKNNNENYLLRKFLYPKTMNIICQFTFDLKIRSIREILAQNPKDSS
ncbi:hypothetical protein HPMG_01501 [Helicobacter pullorum MIT 98-5489]|uniref:Uncharacterized protein n=1 Tax=Helicobacter pullorum MIT 98-5489 TaxID=537972 RepID=C5F189_9HELI|nr:hypothetical protein HPMG_01501 [Helicobacter pullorum MIT 98-5489]